MIVEQRIGRIQRLASVHASVCIFNIILRGTFEECIVGRLMEKLQMAAHAIGDVEALLEASGMNDQGEDGEAFNEKIRRLVVASLAGKDVEAATRMEEKSIVDAKAELQSQEKDIDAMLGGMDDSPRDEVLYPHLPNAEKSMEFQPFVLAALSSSGNRLSRQPDGTYVCEREGTMDRISFDDANSHNAVVYRPGTSAFGRLVSGIAAAGQHRVQDLDYNASPKAQSLAKEWIEGFGGAFRSAQVQDVARSFAGTALVRVRAAVAHDSYERLVNVTVSPDGYWVPAGPTGASPISDPLKSPDAVGVSTSTLIDQSIADKGVNEFCRFYIDRRKQELEAAGTDPRKRKKLEDDFTPRLEALLVGLEGSVRRRLTVKGTFDFGSGPEYQSAVVVIPSENTIVEAPELGQCSRTNKSAPVDCLERCEISGLTVLRHLLTQSEVTGRKALPEFVTSCGETGKRALKDELERSVITQKLIIGSALKTSELTGMRAEARFFKKCEFTGAEAIEVELATSQVSGKKFRRDREERSAVSGKFGYTDEFISCSETKQRLLADEAERCEVTGKLVVPGLLARCDLTGKKVLPSELEKSSISGKRALKHFFVSSSISGVRLLQDEGIASAAGKYCLPQEAKSCVWSGRKCHPEDLRTCQLTHITTHFEFMTTNGAIRFEPLVDLLNGLTRKTDIPDSWSRITARVAEMFDGRMQMQASVSSANGQILAVCVETKNWLGLRVRQGGFLYAFRDRAPIGRIVLGKRGTDGWTFEKVL
jgi:hypothetical protein